MMAAVPAPCLLYLLFPRLISRQNIPQPFLTGLALDPLIHSSKLLFQPISVPGL